MAPIIHEQLRFSNLNNDQLNNKEMTDKINFISDIMNHMPPDLHESTELLLSSYLAKNDIMSIYNEKNPDVMKKIAYYHIKEMINDLGIYDDFCSQFKINISETKDLYDSIQKLEDEEGLSVPMYLINKLASIEQITIFLISYQIIDPKFLFNKVKNDRTFSGHSFISYITKMFLQLVKKQTSIKDLDYSFHKFQISFIFSLINITKSPKKNDILNQIVDEKYRLLDIMDEIILELYIKCCENDIKPDKCFIGFLVYDRITLTSFDSIKSDSLAPDWTSSINICSKNIPFPRLEYWNGLRRLPRVLESFYENEKNLQLSQLDVELEFVINYFNKISEISLNSLPEISQKIFKMIHVSHKESSNNISLRNIPYFLNQMDIHFLHDGKVIITDEFLQNHDLLTFKGFYNFVHLCSGFDYQVKKAEIKENEHNYHYNEKSSIKDFAYDYVRRICSLLDINKKFLVNDDNENEFDKYINDFENISINLPDLKIEGLTIPMYIINQKINNLSSFLAAYEQLDPKFATKIFKRTGNFRGYSVLSFVFYNFLSDIENASDNLFINYIESIYVILNNLDCQPEQKRLKILSNENVDNLKMLELIITETNNHKDKFKKKFIDKRIVELNDIRNRFLNLSPK